MPVKILVAALAGALGACCMQAHADDNSFNDIFSQGHVDGELRAYDFARLYDTKTTPDAHAFALTLLLNAQTGTFGGGFSFGGSFATANSLGTQSGTVAKIDTSLMGPHQSIGAFPQLFAQFQRDWVLVRGGFQYLNTPWMGGNDSRVIPSSYNAILTKFTPVDGWDIYGIRSFDWKSRTSNGMYADNLYYPSTYDNDSMYGNNGSLPANARSATGTWTGGTTYTGHGLKLQAWYYNFMHFARMGYVEGSYTLTTGTPFNPFIAAQYVTESSGTDNVLVNTQTKLFGLPGTRVSNDTWGADLGTSVFDGRVDVAYNKMEYKPGAVGGGTLISPYTTNYATDPLYTTSMIRGLVEEGPGHAWKAKALYNFFNKKLQLVAAYAKYDTYLRGNSHDIYADIIYNFDGYLKGLTLRDRWERSTGGTGNLNPGNESFTYNRLMITYKF